VKLRTQRRELRSSAAAGLPAWRWLRKQRVYGLLLPLAAAFLASACAAQSAAGSDADTASYEIEVFSSSSVGVHNYAQGDILWNAGGRFGWMLTDRRKNHFYSSRLEFALDLAPLYVNFQQNGGAWALSVDPAVLKWNFTPHHGLEPFYEVAFGLLEANRGLPVHGSHFNFTAHSTVGARILRGPWDWSIGFHYLHVSNAFLFHNPGEDAVGVRVSLARWLK
jgi:Lipid A 3-O-deacylase (PagL)